MRSNTIFILHPLLLFSNEFKEYATGGARSTQGDYEKCMQNFGWKTQRDETNWETQKCTKW